jgi:hypothetical protein
MQMPGLCSLFVKNPYENYFHFVLYILTEGEHLTTEDDMVANGGGGECTAVIWCHTAKKPTCNIIH